MFNRYRLELIVFGAGAIVMVLEISATRLLAPYVGTSLHVWTSIIGVILASLSAGYYFGGRLADRHRSENVLGLLLLAAGVWIGLLAFVGTPILGLVNTLGLSVTTQAILDSILLLAAPSLLLGAVSPYTTRLRLTTVDTAGATIGRLGAIGTIGSIAGTFLGGLVLISLLGTHNILITLGCTLLLLSLVASAHKRQIFTAIGIALVLILLTLSSAKAKDIDIDTQYSRILIKDEGATRVMYIGGVTNSACR